MREFTKSMTSYAWAMSLFGLQQMANVFRPEKATAAFNNVTKATEEEFGGALKATFHAGDSLQKGLVDVTFGVFTLGMLDRGGANTSDIARQTGEAFRQGGRVVNRAVEAISKTVQTGTSAVAGAAQQTSGGWGAMPGTTPQPQAPPRPSAAPPKSATPPTGGQQGWGPMPAQK